MTGHSISDPNISRYLNRLINKIPKESDLVKDIMDWLKQEIPDPKEIKKIHGSPFQKAGYPDIELFWLGSSWHFEAKVGKNVPTPLQIRRIKKLRETGNHAWVVRSLEEVKKIITPHIDQMIASCYKLPKHMMCDGVNPDGEVI